MDDDARIADSSMTTFCFSSCIGKKPDVSKIEALRAFYINPRTVGHVTYLCKNSGCYLRRYQARITSCEVSHQAERKKSNLAAGPASLK